MAAGDVIADIQSLLTGTSFNIQPAAGVEMVIISFGGAANVNCRLQAYDGTNGSVIVRGTDTILAGMKVGINNTDYARLNNNDGATQVLAYSAVQVK